MPASVSHGIRARRSAWLPPCMARGSAERPPLHRFPAQHAGACTAPAARRASRRARAAPSSTLALAAQRAAGAGQDGSASTRRPCAPPPPPRGNGKGALAPPAAPRTHLHLEQDLDALQRRCCRLGHGTRGGARHHLQQHEHLLAARRRGRGRGRGRRRAARRRGAALHGRHGASAASHAARAQGWRVDVRKKAGRSARREKTAAGNALERRECWAERDSLPPFAPAVSRNCRGGMKCVCARRSQ
jgi:hypothetical protein